MQDEPNDAGADCPPVTLTLEQRDAIYRVLVAETYSLTDLDLEGLSRDSFERLRDAIRFLEEIGPGPLDLRESFEITMPPGQLQSVIRRALKWADEGLEEFRQCMHDPGWLAVNGEEGLDTMKPIADEHLDTRSACIAALEQLDPDGARH